MSIRIDLQLLLPLLLVLLVPNKGAGQDIPLVRGGSGQRILIPADQRHAKLPEALAPDSILRVEIVKAPVPAALRILLGTQASQADSARFRNNFERRMETGGYQRGVPDPRLDVGRWIEVIPCYRGACVEDRQIQAALRTTGWFFRSVESESARPPA